MIKISGQFLISGQYQDSFKISGISGQLGALELKFQSRVHTDYSISIVDSMTLQYRVAQSMKQTISYRNARHLKGPVGERAPPRFPTHVLFDLLFAHSTSSLFKPMTMTTAVAGGASRHRNALPNPALCLVNRHRMSAAIWTIGDETATALPYPICLICGIRFKTLQWLQSDY